MTAAVASAGALAAVLAVHRLWRVWPPAGTLLRSLLVCALAYGLAVLWPTPGFWVLLKLPAIAMVCALAYWLLGEFSRSEVELAVSMLRLRPRQDSL